MNSSEYGSAGRIEQFLAKYPDGPLTVAVGYASVKGIAWLARHTADRPVTLLIGNCRKSHFTKWSGDDRAGAVAFINRPDVDVKNWYKKRPTPSEAHMKVWVAHTTTIPRVLLGSANLTGAGLFRNREAVAEAAEPDRHQIVNSVDELVGKAWDLEARLLGYLGEETEHQATTKQPAPKPVRVRSPDPAPVRPQPSVRRQPTPTVRRRGCLSAVISAATVVAVIVAALNVW